MKSLIYKIVATALLAAPLMAGAQKLDLWGYYEHTLQGEITESKDTSLLMNISKLRLDMEAGTNSDELRFTGNVNFQLLSGATAVALDPYLPDNIAEYLAARDITEFHLERERIFLDNAFLTWTKGRYRIRAGKQQLSWGPGYSFNPTDLFHAKNILDPTYEKEGVSALRGDATWGIGGRLTAIIAPAATVDSTGYALRVADHFESLGLDAAVTLHHVIDSTSVDTTTLATRYQYRNAIGLELSGTLLGLGVWAEGNWNNMEREEDFARVVAGAEYTLENGLYLMAEGLYNGRSSKRTGHYSVHDWMGYLFYSEPVSQAWWLAGAQKDVGELSSGSVYVFGGLDGSLLINPRLDISISQNADLVLYGGITAGEADGQFPPGLVSLLARCSVYF